MTTEISHARIGAFKAIGQSFGASFRHWRWLSLTVLFALLLGWIAALPIVRQLKASLGFNDSALHWDLVNTEDKTVTALLKGGGSVIIYKGGEFQL